MKMGIRRSAVVIFGLLVLANFNNCGVYESGPVDANSFLAASLECESETDCVVKSNTNLKVTPLPNNNYPVTASLRAFNVGGDCNEAGYYTHQIVWRLLLNNVVVRTSDMVLVGGQPAHSTCVNGKFRAYVNLDAIETVGADRVSRVGLSNGNGGRSSYELQFEIIGRENSTGNWVRNANQGGVKSITLIPL